MIIKMKFNFKDSNVARESPELYCLDRIRERECSTSLLQVIIPLQK
jgi:hypothetical protein